MPGGFAAHADIVEQTSIERRKRAPLPSMRNYFTKNEPAARYPAWRARISEDGV